MTSRFCRFVILLGAMGLSAGPALALINPKFTPVDLVKDSQVILVLKFDGEVKAGKATAQVVKTLKGEFKEKTIVVELAGATKPDQARMVEKGIADYKDGPVLLFIMPPKAAAGPAGAPANNQTTAFMHLEHVWLSLVQEDKTWGFDQVNQEMAGTWNGGSDMLIRCVEYILKDPAPAVPFKTGTKWAGTVKLGKVPGKITDMLAVDLKGDGKPVLFVASDAGDHLIITDGKTTQDITEKTGLTSKSLVAAWGDFNGDCILDLASWDGKNLRLFLQDKDGKFTAAPGGDINQCISLSTVDAGDKAGLIVGTAAAPLIVTTWQHASVMPLSRGFLGKDLGKAGPCLVADFDGDGQVDVLQLLEKGSLLYKGTKPGEFAALAACAVTFGEGANACTGDWDGDGMLDIFIAGKDGSHLWQNLGSGKFVEATKLSGEIGYASKAGASWACNADLNNDGRQDIVVLYSAAAPQVFFNRGFRSFGVSGSMDLGSGEFLPEALKGQQAGCVADFTGDGGQDLAIATTAGEIVLIVRASGDDLAGRLLLPPKSGAGPVRAWANLESRGLGAWNIRSGLCEGFITRPESGAVTLQYQFPGQKAQSKEVVLEKKPVNVVLQPPTK